MTATTAQVTRAELEDAIREHLATLRRMPVHWVDRRAAYHERINALLGDWLAAGP